MANIKHRFRYNCSDDCKMSGCPSHEAQLIYQSTSDAYTFENGKGGIKIFERGELEVFIRLLKELNRFDAININKDCEHKNSYHFHNNAPRYCPDCGKYPEE